MQCTGVGLDDLTERSDQVTGAVKNALNSGDGVLGIPRPSGSDGLQVALG